MIRKNNNKGIKKFITQRVTPTLLVVLMLLSMISTIPVSANNSSNTNFYIQSAQLIAENWSDDYFGSIVLEIGESSMMIDGEEKEIDSEGTTPIIVDNVIMLPVEALINELNEEPFWDDMMLDVTSEGDLNTSVTQIETSIIINENEQKNFDIAITNDDQENVHEEHINAEIIIEKPEAIENDMNADSEVIMLPLCVIAENLNLEVNWDNSTGTITLTRDFQTKRIIVKANGNISFNGLGAEKIISGRDGIHVLQFDCIVIAQDAHNKLESMSSIIYVEPDVYVPLIETESTNSSTVTGFEHKSWGVEKIGADKYAAYLVENNKTTLITVAVLDTGVDANHTFLGGRVRNDGLNTITGGSNTSDINGHGTHVTGTIIDNTPNLNNIVILPVKVLGDFSGGTWLSVGNGISFATDMSVQVINMSLGGMRGSQCSFVDEMVQYAVNKKVTVVVAAGNESWDANNTCPAHIENIITVSAVNSNYSPAWFSNYGSVVDIAAPGVSVNSSIPGNKFASYDGTSMAAPHVAAVVAMYILNDSNLTPNSVQTLLKQNYDTPAGWQSKYGVGVVNIAKALDMETPDEPDIPDEPDVPTGIVLTSSNTSATANVGAGVGGRVPVTVTAPSNSNVTVTLNAPGGSSNANDPALYNSAGTRIAYQNNGNWGFTHTLNINAGQSWSGFVGTGGDVARQYTLTSTGWTSAVTLTLNPTSVTVDDNNLTRSIAAGGTATGNITFDRGTLPQAIQLSVSGNIITATGVRLAAGQAAINGTYSVTVSRGGVSTQLSINVNLNPQVAEINLNQNNTSATANVGVGISHRVPVTVTAPSNSNVTVTLNAPGGSSNANDPALYNSAGTRIAYQNNGWGFTYTLTINAGQSWSGFVGTGGDVARQYILTSTSWTPAGTLTLNQTSVTVDDNNLTRSITAGGTTAGNITFDRGTLPQAVQLSVLGNTITATGIHPAADQAAIIGTHTVTVNREGVSTQLSISVNLTPQDSGITLTQSNTSATANVGVGVGGRVPITVTAPSNSNVTVTLNGPGETGRASGRAREKCSG
ncbi:MAG: S8 family serine peptidase [Oscillospiraceae bacterium]|jgi:hypothetical protein|nr:S8 family serine peptidase [Oscillospiraceae bacterium]